MLSKLQQAPKAMQMLAAGLVAVALLAGTALISLKAVLIAVVGLALIAGAIFAWTFYVSWRGRQRTRAMTGSLTAAGAGKHGAITDPAQLAQLDRLRENFSKGIEKFQAVGKDLYSLPWYVVCGEPGSGKTEAVRRCKVGFPPGLQDEMQGAGGTINMHWWFTNHAVLIDTAGKLLFQQAPPGGTTEWTEFLKLLRVSRPHCPINGLLLVIPSESLIKDTFEEIEGKARKIADQLQVIQRTLDVRFPVFVLITKCDKIVGFREFFAGIKNQQLQDQMTGWSNPAPLDSPFQMEAVSQHLAEVVKRIGRRQLGLLKDPVPTDAGKKRLDEVDSLYALSSSVTALAPRLRKYLETLFGHGVTGGKPLFLRGIYFTSALTEGKELDTELAAALGLSEDQLPASKAWERERSFFLKDLFLHKVFREKGLVTRASNTDQLMRKRQLAIGVVVLAGMLAVLAVSVFGYLALKSSVGAELVFWRPGAHAENWNGPKWKPIVNSRLEYTGNDIVQLDDKREWPIIQFHETLQRRVGSDLQIPWVYKPLEAVALNANASRRAAQRILFEASVVGPVLEANRDRLINAAEWDQGDSDRLTALIRLEGAVHLKGQSGYDPDYPAEDFFNPLLKPSLAKVPTGATDLDTLVQVFDWTYNKSAAGKGLWPAAWLSRGPSLRDNQPLNRGWDALERSVKEGLEKQMQTVQTIRAGRLTAVRYVESEKAFLRAIAEPRTSRLWKQDVVSAWEELVARRQAMDKLYADLKARVKQGDEVLLDAAYRATREGMRGETDRASKLIKETLQKQKAAADAAAEASSGPASEYTLHRDFERKLTALTFHVNSQLEQVMSPGEEAQLGDLDTTTFNAVNNGVPAYQVRCEAYALGLELVAPPAGAAPKPAAADELRSRATKYIGPLRSEFRAAVNTLAEAAAAPGS
jgi:hypothetical protein